MLMHFCRNKMVWTVNLIKVVVGQEKTEVNEAQTHLKRWGKAQALPLMMLVSTVLTLVMCRVTLFIIRKLGFGENGILPNTVASTWQAAIGNMEEGSWFTTLQSTGVHGFSWKQRLFVCNVVYSVLISIAY
nr:uncharacterized protein LOC129384129 [Dermacentor andersoni]